MDCRLPLFSVPIRPLVAALVAVLPAALALAEPKYAGWTKVEASREVREIKERLREGGQLDKAARDFFEATVLPQLELDENRSLIERTRKRIRELALGDVADDKAYGEIALLLAERMTALARDEQAEPVVRVNAMLLVSELKSKDGKPWPPAALALASAAGDKELPVAVRIAALVGVAKHVAAGGGDEAVVKTFGPPVMAILAEPTPPDQAVEHDWLASRALQLVPLLMQPAPPKASALLAALVADEARSIDLRVRAAAALGATADAQSGVDAAALVETIRALAVRALEAEEKAAAARRFEDRYRRGGAAPAGGPAAPPGMAFDGQPLPAFDPLAIPEQACRRAAWRLFALGTAILSADGKQGLATLLGDAGGPAQELARQLVNEAARIDKTPDEDALLDALDSLRPPVPGAKPTQRAPRQPTPESRDGEEKKPAVDPNASPFDNPFQ